MLNSVRRVHNYLLYGKSCHHSITIFAFQLFQLMIRLEASILSNWGYSLRIDANRQSPWLEACTKPHRNL